MKTRNYDKSYIAYGFSCVIINNIERPHCVLCLKTLANASLKPSKLVDHLKKKHPEHINKPQSYFEQKQKALSDKICIC